jgi:hypothetical protein
MSDLLITAAILAVMALGMAVITTVPPGAGARFMQGRRYHRAGLARHAVRAIDAAPLPALETVPDPVSPFAARTA